MGDVYECDDKCGSSWCKIPVAEAGEPVAEAGGPLTETSPQEIDLSEIDDTTVQPVQACGEGAAKGMAVEGAGLLHGADASGPAMPPSPVVPAEPANSEETSLPREAEHGEHGEGVGAAAVADAVAAAAVADPAAAAAASETAAETPESLLLQSRLPVSKTPAAAWTPAAAVTPAAETPETPAETPGETPGLMVVIPRAPSSCGSQVTQAETPSASSQTTVKEDAPLLLALTVKEQHVQAGAPAPPLKDDLGDKCELLPFKSQSKALFNYEQGLKSHTKVMEEQAAQEADVPGYYSVALNSKGNISSKGQGARVGIPIADFCEGVLPKDTESPYEVRRLDTPCSPSFPPSSAAPRLQCTEIRQQHHDLRVFQVPRGGRRPSHGIRRRNATPEAWS